MTTIKNNKIKDDANRNKLITKIKSCLDILRDGESLTGDKALRNLGYHLNLRLLEKELGKTIDIDNYPGYNIEIQLKNRLLKAACYSNLVKEEEDNITKFIEKLWKQVLSVHPDLSPIFPDDEMFNIKHNSTHLKIIKILLSFNFEEIEEDILGEAYEEVTKDIMTGRILGQFFTPPAIKNLVVDIINPRLKDDGTIETVFDPSMGTGGFLISTLRHIIKQSKERKISINWDFVRHEGLGGREIEPDTYKLAKSNMLISSGRLFKTLELGDSLRNIITNKYDIVVANPPFGIKGLNYDEISDSIKIEYLPIKSKNAVSLFLQAIIYILKVGGRCGIVLPDGQDLFATSSDLIMIREFLMKTCDLKEIIHLPANAFSNTSIKTCVFIFNKVKEGKDVLKRTTKKVRGNETEILTMSNEHQTKNVAFYNYDFEMKIKNLLIKVPIDDIAKNNYSLNYSQYVKKEEVNYADGIIVKTLGEVCDMISGSQLSKSNFVNGVYPVIGGGQQPIGYHNAFNKPKNSILCSSSGSAGFISRYNTEVWASDCFSITSKVVFLNDNYLYYYLKHIQENIYQQQSGAAQPHIYPKSIENINIPIPSLEIQQEIVDYLDILEETNKIKLDEIMKLKESMKTFMGLMIRTNNIKTLGEVCDMIRGSQLAKSNFVDGVYPVIGGGQQPIGYHNAFNKPKNSILCSSSGSAGFISRYNTEVWASDCFSITSKVVFLNDNYLYYYLKHIQENIYQQQSGAAQPHINPKSIENINIPIPSIETQIEIGNINDVNESLIKKYEELIEINKRITKTVINITILQNKDNDDDDEKPIVKGFIRLKKFIS